MCCVRHIYEIYILVVYRVYQDTRRQLVYQVEWKVARPNMYIALFVSFLVTLSSSASSGLGSK